MLGLKIPHVGRRMLLLRHVVFALTYGALAIAVALTLPYSVPGMEKWTAVAIGALILIFGAVLHEVWARQERERALLGELVELAAARDAVLDELACAREEVRAIRGALLDGPASAQSLDAVKEDVRTLRRLVAGISDRPAAEAAPPERRIDPRALGDDEALALVRDAIRHDRVDIALQPIVSLPQRKLRHYQAFSRIRTSDGLELLPHRVAGLAARDGLAAALDGVVLFRSVQLARETLRRHRSVNVLARISSHSLDDGAFMEQFVAFMAANPELASRLVFALSMADLRAASAAPGQPIDRLADLGFRFCVDGPAGLDELDLALVEQSPVRFLKTDARSLLAALDRPDAIDVKALKRELDRSAIDLIVDGIDDEPTLIELLDLPIDYGQGALFGEPRG